MSRTKKMKGFTLIELMIVVAIIGILAAVAIPKFANLVTKSKEAAVKGTLGSLRSAVSIYYGDNEGEYPGELFAALTTDNKYMPGVGGASSLGKYEIPKNSHGNPGHTGGLWANANAVGAVTAGALAAGSFDDQTPLWYVNQGDSEGEVYINCTHQDTKQSQWTGY